MASIYPNKRTYFYAPVRSGRLYPDNHCILKCVSYFTNDGWNSLIDYFDELYKENDNDDHYIEYIKNYKLSHSKRTKIKHLKNAGWELKVINLEMTIVGNR